MKKAICANSKFPNHPAILNEKVMPNACCANDTFFMVRDKIFNDKEQARQYVLENMEQFVDEHIDEVYPEEVSYHIERAERFKKLIKPLTDFLGR